MSPTIQTLLIEIFDVLEEGKIITGESDPTKLRWKWICPETQREWILRLVDFKRMDRSNPFDQLLYKSFKKYNANHFPQKMLEDPEIREEIRELKKYINFL